MIVLALLVACHPVDPELASRRAALDAYQRGEAALAAKDPVAAEAAFDQALAARPGDALLRAWKAKAQADAGHLDEAITTLDAVLKDDPGFAEARYDRAAWLARAGRPEDSAVELEIALQGALDVHAADVLDDPDFAPYLDHPAFSGIIPRQPLAVVLDGPEGTVFWGSDFDVRLTVIGAPVDRVVEVTAPATGPLRLVGVVEDDTFSTDGPARTLTFRLLVTGAGEVHIGPVDVAVGARTGRNGKPLVVTAAAPPGKESGASLPPGALRSARTVLGDHGVPSAWRDDGVLYVAAGFADRVVLEPPVAADVTWELRRGSRRDTVITASPAASGTKVTVTRGGTELLTTSL